MKEIEMTMSFRKGNGSIEHNLRITKSGDERQNWQNCDPRRRDWNKVLYNKNMDDVLHSIIDKKLLEYNLKQQEKGHPERQKSFDDWKNSVEYTRKGKHKSIYTEYIIQGGDKFTGCPFEYLKNEKGQAIDKKGRIIPLWDTRKNFVPLEDENGNLIPSDAYYRLCKFYEAAALEFVKKNPNFIPVCITIHADEEAGIHLHLGGCFLCKTKIGLCVGFGKTESLRQQYEEQGIICNKTRYNNALKRFTEETREKMLPSIGIKYGIKRIDGKSAGRKNQTIKQYKKEQAELCAELARQKREQDETAKQQRKTAERQKQREQELREKYEAIVNEELKTQKNFILRERKIFQEMFPTEFEAVREENIKRVSEERKTKNTLTKNTLGTLKQSVRDGIIYSNGI